MSNKPGLGVKRFWDLVEKGQEPDLADLARSFPSERLALAEAMYSYTRQTSAARRERMWSARNRVMLSRGEQVSLGTLIREKRISAGLKVEDVAKRLAQGGSPVASDAVRRLEEDRLSPVAVRPPSLWRELSNMLSIDTGQLMAFLETALQGPRAVQQFTRMERGATEEDREAFIEGATEAASDQSTRYLDDVRRELGLTSNRGHLV